MQGIVTMGYGQPEVLQETTTLTKPVIKDDQLLVEVKASTLNIADYIGYVKPIQNNNESTFASLLNQGVSYFPQRPGGIEFAGVVKEVGAKVTDFQIGEYICGLALGGAWAEYVAVDQKMLYHAPKDFSYVESAALPVDSVTAYGAVKKAVKFVGANVLINGASGGVGHFALQIAKAFQANVTAVCSTRNVELAYQLGADQVIDYKKEDFSDYEQKYDAIIAINGYQPLSKYRDHLKKQGRFVMVGGKPRQDIEGIVGGLFYMGREPKITSSAYPFLNKKLTMEKVVALANVGKLKPYLDHVYPVDEIPAAIRYIVETHAQGKVGINVNFSE